MKQDFTNIKKEIIKRNILIKSMYGGDNSKHLRGKIRKLETELDVLLYKYYKGRFEFSEGNELNSYFE